jgi:putative phosphotransacetylase
MISLSERINAALDGKLANCSAGLHNADVIFERREMVRLALDKLCLHEVGRLEDNEVPIGVSARHLHVTHEHFAMLFGPDSELTPYKPLNGGQWSSTSQVALVSPAMKCLEAVRILGPFRKETQVEISRSDARTLKLNPSVRPSGVLEGTIGIALVGPYGAVSLQRGLIIANRHVHLPPAKADRLSLKDNDYVHCLVAGERNTVLCDVQVRVDPTFTPEMHIDTDDANTVGLPANATAILLGISGSGNK